jgi:glycosyltransferase involved in cell wall biosynthesis
MSMMSERIDISAPPDTRAGSFRLPSRRVCLVTGELAGPDYNGGIGTAVRGLALALARSGYRVDILYTRVERLKPFCFRGAFEDQVDAFRRNGIRLTYLPHDGEWNDWLAKSYSVMIHLKAQQYDQVFFNDMHGAGYYAQLARRTASPDFERTTMAVVLHSATQWITELNQAATNSIEDIRLVEMERRSIELADAIISPSTYMIEKYRAYGWKLPADAVVIPNLLPSEHRQRHLHIRTSPTDEIVFFGRLERRKGLWLFCEAVNRIKHEIKDVKITFLGKMTEENGELTGFHLLRRAAAWPFEVQILHDFDREQALSYLKAGRRVAVMPARQDNSPCAILECLYEGIPFIASNGSGGQELVSKECCERNFFVPSVEALSSKLRSVLRNGAATGLPAIEPSRNEKMVLDWLARTMKSANSTERSPTASATPAHGTGRATPGEVILIAASHLGPEQVLAYVGRLAQFRGINLRMTILTDDPAAFTDRVPEPPPKTVVVADVRDFETIIQSRAKDSSSVSIFHVTQVITPEWLPRAEHCLDEVPEISALTGLVAVPEESPSHLHTHSAGQKVRSFRIGFSPVMFPLGPDTNTGFITLRPEVVRVIQNISPFDAQYERIKCMQDFVHELVVRLAEHGHRFEVMPDPVLEDTLDEQPSPSSRFGRTARSLDGVQVGHAPGSERALLARLAVEATIGAEKRRAAGDSLSYLSAKLGRRLADARHWATKEDTVRTLVAMAHAAGQTELAHELAMEGLLPREEFTTGPRVLAAAVRRSKVEIRLFDLVAAGAFTGFNLSHEWSFKVLADLREIELHPNSSLEGRAGVMFSDLDLTDTDVLRGAIRLAYPYCQPVRFRVDIMAVDGSRHFGLHRVVRPNETLQLEERLPSEVLTRCNLNICTEMANPSDQAEGAWARWADIRLTTS